MFALTTGLRIGTMLSLKIGEIKWDLFKVLREEGINVDSRFSEADKVQIGNIAMYKIKFARGRKMRGDNSYFGFIPAETVKVLREYFSWRERNGEKLGLESWLFGKEQITHTQEPIH